MNVARNIRNLTRWRDVQVVLLRHGFDILFDQEEIRKARRILRDRLHVSVGDFSGRTNPVRVRQMVEELGPTYVKLGQIFSSRSDLLPPDWIAELSKLQDSVPAFSFDQVRQIIEEERGKPLEEIFLEFQPEPIAAASIGQVHRAVLLDHARVVVKVQRPNIQRQVQSDMEMMAEIAHLMEDRTNWGKRYRLELIVDEFARTLENEMDYRNEASNAGRLRTNLLSQPNVHVPSIYWDLTSKRVLTMEAVEGIKINDLAALDAAGVNRSQVAEIFLHSIFKQLLVDGFFHADPHPGNLFYDPELERLNYLDMGMMGSLLPEQRLQLGDTVLAILNRDSREVMHQVLTIGSPFEPINEIKLQRLIDHIINRYLDVSLDSISFSALMSEILRAVFEHGVRLPSELSLAMKAFIQGEDVARNLDPNICILDITRSVAGQVLRQRLEPRFLQRRLTTVLRENYRLAQAIPHTLENVLQQLEKGSFKFSMDMPDFRRQMLRLTAITNRMTAGLIVAGMLIGSAIAMGVSPQTSWAFIPVLGTVGFLLSTVLGALLVWLVFWDMLRNIRKKDD